MGNTKGRIERKTREATKRGNKAFRSLSSATGDVCTEGMDTGDNYSLGSSIRIITVPRTVSDS